MDTLPLFGSESNLTKRCTACGNEFPATPEFFYRNKKGRDGLLTQCKECCKISRKVYEKEHRDTIREKAKRYKQEHAEEIKIWTKQYREEHREATLEQSRQYEREHREERRAKQRLSYQTAEYKHAQHFRRHARRARLQNATGSHTREQVEEQYQRQKGKCYYCHKKVKREEYHADHVVPLSRGGSNDISNIVVTCPFCNFSKRDKLPHEWARGGRLF